MLSFVITQKNGSSETLDRVLTAKLDSELGVPADSLLVACPYSSDLCENADYISVTDDEQIVFRGQIDEINVVKRDEGVITVLYARSFAGALLDNEAEPITYINPSASLIFARHAKKFGLQGYDADDVPFNGSLKIDKGMTHWQVLRNFCINRYGCEPRISSDSKVLFRGIDVDRKVTFGNLDGQIAYTSLKESRVRCTPISQVKLKLSDFDNYSSAVNNKNPECECVERVRYVDATANNTTIETADRMIENSNRKSYCISLECVGCHTGYMGFRAEVDDNIIGKIDGLEIVKICTTLDSRGWRTSILLRKEF